MYIPTQLEDNEWKCGVLCNGFKVSECRVTRYVMVKVVTEKVSDQQATYTATIHTSIECH